MAYFIDATIQELLYSGKDIVKVKLLGTEGFSIKRDEECLNIWRSLPTETPCKLLCFDASKQIQLTTEVFLSNFYGSLDNAFVNRKRIRLESTDKNFDNNAKEIEIKSITLIA